MQKNQFQRFGNLLEEFKQYIERVQGELKKFNVASTEVDVLEFEGKQYRRVYRKAQPGDVVVFERTNKPEWVTVGKPYKAEEIEGELMFVDDDGYHCFVYGGYITSHNFEDVIVYEPIQEITLNQLRAEIIEKAKKFVKKYSKGSYYNAPHFISGEPLAVHFGQTDVLEFVVNEKKRTVVALIKTKEGRKVFHRGIAKCHPDDVFNEHIGKAIALGRALGLDVSEFEQAVQPTEVVVGTEVLLIHIGRTDVVEEERIDLANDGIDSGDVKIINDTNAQY